VTGFGTFSGPDIANEQGDKLRVRAELFADHYSQARLFWNSLTDNERAHVASSFTFELSKVQLEQVPPRMITFAMSTKNLRNVSPTEWDSNCPRKIRRGPR
jgi:catalase